MGQFLNVFNTSTGAWVSGNEAPSMIIYLDSNKNNDVTQFTLLTLNLQHLLRLVTNAVDDNTIAIDVVKIVQI